MTEMPYTTDDLTESEMGEMSLPDQIRYAVYNGDHRPDAIVEQVTFSADWTTEIIEDMVAEDSLIEQSDDVGLFYQLPESERQTEGLSDEERAEIHEEARRKRAAATVIGDEEDVSMKMESESTDSTTETASTDDPDASYDSDEVGVDHDEAHGKSALTAGGSDDTVAGPEPTTEDIEESRKRHDGQLPADRDYDWASEKLDADSVHEYREADGEKSDIIREIEDRRETGKLPHFSISGPTGCGKTTLPEDISVGMDAPCFIIECHEGLRPNNLLGMPTYVGDETWWSDGPLTKALLASQERPVVLIFDEINRTTSRTLGVIMSALDHRCSVTLNARGGEVVKGDPMNLIVFSTMNEGDGYITNQIDRAQVRRLGNKYYTDYIGMYDDSREAELIADRTPVTRDVAQTMVTAANEIRTKANGDSAVKMGVPTSSMLQWAQTAWTYRGSDADGGPLMKGGERAVLNPFFKGNKSEEDIVVTTLESHVRGMSIDEELDDDADDEESVDTSPDIDVSDETFLMCESCGWYDEAGKADADVVAMMECPKCDSYLEPKEAH